MQAGLVLLTCFAVASGNELTKAVTCDTTADAISQDVFRVICPQGCGNSGRIWGTGVYTSDSRLCRAAIHAEIITSGEGGVIKVFKVKGMHSYVGSTQNGITSSQYGSWPTAFTFFEDNKILISCTKRSDSISESIVTVKCPSGCENTGRLWGTDIYTADSYICLAAIHAGIITADEGGQLTVIKASGQDSYDGSTSNGVTSSSYGSYSASFTLSEETITCETTSDSLSKNVSRVLCPPGCGNAGSIWGTGVYTSDSRVCRAAVHAGIITSDEGGVIKIFKIKGKDSYVGSTQNGITSSQYGSWRASFTFSEENKIIISCTKRSDSISESIVTVKCPSGCKNSGRLWGTDIYTGDSYICLAAIHAGIITENGGLVQVEKLSGRSSYDGSTRNSVDSAQYGPWEESFSVTMPSE